KRDRSGRRKTSRSSFERLQQSLPVGHFPAKKAGEARAGGREAQPTVVRTWGPVGAGEPVSGSTVMSRPWVPAGIWAEVSSTGSPGRAVNVPPLTGPEGARTQSWYR